MPILNEASADNTPTTAIINQTEASNHRGASSRVAADARLGIECLICVSQPHSPFKFWGAGHIYVKYTTQLLPTTSFMGWKQVASKKRQERSNAIVHFELEDSQWSAQELGMLEEFTTSTSVHVDADIPC